MTKVIELDRYDIKDIIAEHFQVDKSKVEVNCYIDTVGYYEEQVPTVRVTVREPIVG